MKAENNFPFDLRVRTKRGIKMKNHQDLGAPDTNSPGEGTIMTVMGAIPPDKMGFTLAHEHIMSTFGAESARYPSYDAQRLFETVLPYLERVKGMGLQTVIDCTAAYFGRHPELLLKISEESGVHLVTNTGYYGAAEGIYVPSHVTTESIDQLAERWVREWVYDIDGTGVKPGFIKTAVDGGPLAEIDQKLIRAAARTHLQTGLTIQTHTGDDWMAVQEILYVLRDEGVHPSAWIWVHAHQVETADRITQVAEQGGWISLDGIVVDNVPHVLGLVKKMKERGHLDRVLLSHDGDLYNVDGELRPFHLVLSDFIPALLEDGFSAQEVHQMTVENPRRAFTVGVRSGD
jgi:phosphotriesterase-related protein